MRTTTAFGLNGLRSAENVKDLHEEKKALTKSITIPIKRKESESVAENVQLKCKP